MTAYQIWFYIIASMILGGALLAVTARKIFRAAIALLVSLIGIAALYYWMHYEFIAAVQTIVYVGGIVVLIIFSIFLTHNPGHTIEEPVSIREAFAFTGCFAGFAFVFSLLNRYSFEQTGDALNHTMQVADVGRALLSTGSGSYLLPFEAVSLLLLASMIGCIVIAIKIRTHK